MLFSGWPAKNAKGRDLFSQALRPPICTPRAAAGRDWLALQEQESPAPACHGAPGGTWET